MHCFHGFQLQEQTIAHQDIESEGFIENQALVLDFYNLLPARRNGPQLKLSQKTPLINRFNQPGSFVPMNFNGRANYFAAEPISLFKQSVHRGEL